MAVDPHWLGQLQSKLNTVLSKSIPEAERARYLDAAAMQTWVLAFTHESYDPNYNFERLEFMGDMVLKFAFSKYLLKRFPDQSNAGLTELNRAYMSADLQGKLSQSLGFPQLTRVAREMTITPGIVKDIFESFFGALAEVGDTAQGQGVGYIRCYNLIVELFQSITINLEETEGGAKTQVQQIFKRFNKGIPEEITDTSSGNTVTIRLTPEQLDFMSQYSITIDPVIGRGTGDTLAAAQGRAYKNALDALKSVGISTTWARLAKQVADFLTPDLEPLYEQLVARVNRDGYTAWYFIKPRKAYTENKMLIQLLGEKPGGFKVVLASVSMNYTASDKRESEVSGRIAAVQKYLATKPAS